MILPELPEPVPHTDVCPESTDYYTEAQMIQLQADTIDAVLSTAFVKANLFGKTGENMWISIKSAVRYEQKRLETT